MRLPWCISLLPSPLPAHLGQPLLPHNEEGKGELGSFISWLLCLSALIPPNSSFSSCRDLIVTSHTALRTPAMSWGLLQVGQLPDWTSCFCTLVQAGFLLKKIVIPSTPRHEQCNRAAASKHSSRQEILWSIQLCYCHFYSSPVAAASGTDLTVSWFWAQNVGHGEHECTGLAAVKPEQPGEHILRETSQQLVPACPKQHRVSGTVSFLGGLRTHRF